MLPKLILVAPRAVPDVIGVMFEPYSKRIPAGSSGGALACWNDIRGITSDRRDGRRAAAGGWDTITAISPPPGTLVDRDEPITVHLAPMDYDALYIAGAFPVDAASDYSLHPDENATPISGLGLAARCVTDLQGTQDTRYNEVVVLLDGNRLFEAQGLGAQPCDQLKKFAQTAIDRI
jgi:hypothetical protein